MLGFRMARGAIRLAAANSSAQGAVWAERDRKARIAKNMPAVESAITACSPEAKAEAEYRRINRELDAIRAQIAAIKAQQTAVKATVAAGNAYIGRV
jgi:hypothetical protein